MRKRFLLLMVGVALAGCGAGPAAQRRYDTAVAANDQDAICVEGRKVADNYLSSGDAEAYKLWKARSETQCANNEYDKQRGAPIELADNMTAVTGGE
jgi:hypothetical protein